METERASPPRPCVPSIRGMPPGPVSKLPRAPALPLETVQPFVVHLCKEWQEMLVHSSSLPSSLPLLHSLIIHPPRPAHRLPSHHGALRADARGPRLSTGPDHNPQDAAPCPLRPSRLVWGTQTRKKRTGIPR